MKHTRETLLAMADRELDAMVAENVMGFSARMVRPKGCSDDHRVQCFTDNPACVDGAWNITELVFYFGARPYSTDPAAAWSVSERMGELGWGIYMLRHDCVPTTLGVLFWRDRPMYDHNDERIPQYGSGWLPMPKAVCIAALLAIGEQP